MKKTFFLLLLCMICSINVNALDNILASDVIAVDGICIDSFGYDHAPDSLLISTIKGSTVMFTQGYVVAASEVTADGDFWIFTDQFSDIDGAGGNGYYTTRFEYIYWHGGYSAGKRCTIIKHKYFYIGAEARFKADVSNLDVAVSSRASSAEVSGLSSHDETDVYNEFISGSNEDIFKSDSGFVVTDIKAYLDSTVVARPDGGLLTGTKTIIGTTADTIRYWHDGTYLGRLIITHAVDDPTPDSTWFETSGP